MKKSWLYVSRYKLSSSVCQQHPAIKHPKIDNSLGLNILHIVIDNTLQVLLNLLNTGRDNVKAKPKVYHPPTHKYKRFIDFMALSVLRNNDTLKIKPVTGRLYFSHHVLTLSRMFPYKF